MREFLQGMALLVAMVCAMNVHGNERPTLPPPGEHALEVMSTWDGSLQPSMLFVPTAAADKQMLPLVIALHGKWVDETAWFRFTPVMEKAEERGYVLACPYGRGDLWYRGPGEQDVLDLLQHMIRTQRIDPRRVYLVGHSMGGWGTWWVGLRNADRFASIAPMAGFAPMDLLPNALHLEPFIIHDRDDDIVGVELSRRPAARLAELGISYRYRETTGYKHDSRLIGDSLDELFDWFDERRRVRDPNRVLLAARTPGKASNGRVHIVAMISPLEPAEVEVEWLGERFCRIQTRNVRTLAIDLRMPPIPWERFPVSVRIDGQEIADTTPPELFLSSNAYDTSQLVLHLEDGRWKTAFPETFPPPAISHDSVSADLERELTDAASQQDIARILGAIVARGANADAMIVRADAFAWFGPPLTRERLADSYVSASEELGTFELDGDQIRAILQGDESLVLAGMDVAELQDQGLYTIVSPRSPLVRSEHLKNPKHTKGPIYTLMFKELGVTSWE